MRTLGDQIQNIEEQLDDLRCSRKALDGTEPDHAKALAQISNAETAAQGILAKLRVLLEKDPDAVDGLSDEELDVRIARITTRLQSALAQRSPKR
jgi:outer membrane protein TolC